MKKQIIAILLTLAIVVAALPQTVSAAGDYTITFGELGDGTSMFFTVTINDVPLTGSYDDGETITVPAGATVKVHGNMYNNTLLEGWQVEPADAIPLQDKRIITFTMPEQNITLKSVAREIDPHATVDANGILTWDAIEGYDCALHICYIDDNSDLAPIELTDLKATDGRYTYDMQTALQEYEWSGGSVQTGEYKATLYYYKNGEQYEDGRAVIEKAATYYYNAGKRITLATPENLHWDEYTAKWDAVEGAASYRVDITCHLPDQDWSLTYTVNTPEWELKDIQYQYLQAGYTYEFAVTALPEKNSSKYVQSTKSEYSDPVTYRTSAAAPTITTQPQDAQYTAGDMAQSLTVEANITDEGTLSYQWYSNTTDSNSGGTVISGATGKSYTPPTDTEGTTWYYCVVTNTLNGMTAQTTSDAAKIEIAPAVISFGITVAGIEVTNKNAGDVLGDGKVSYFPQTKSLLLNGASIDGSNADGAIMANEDLNIVLAEENICKGRIQAEGDLSISGFGSLEVTTTKNNHTCLSSKNGSITITYTTLKLTAQDIYTQAIRCGSESNITIEWANVNAKGPNSGIFCDNGTVQISNSTVTAEGRYGILANYKGSIEISESTVTLNGTDAGGAYAMTMTVRDSDVSVSTDSYAYSLWILDTLKIQNSIFNSQSPQNGICVANLIVDDSSAESATDMTIQCESGNSIYIYSTSGAGQFKVTPKTGVLMDVLAGDTQDDAARIEGAAFDTEKVLSNLYGEKYFRLKVHEHEGTHVPRKEATCTKDGNIEYWYCDGCGKDFADEGLTDEITLDKTVILAKGHGTTQIQNKKDATCTEEGYTGNKVCTVCGEILEYGKTLQKLAHDYKDGKCIICGAVDPSYKPAEIENAENGSASSPQTNDNNNTLPWIILLFASGSALGLMGYSKKKKQAK